MGRLCVSCAAGSKYCTYFTLTLNLLTTTIVAPPSNASKWQMGFNSAFKGLILNFKVLTMNLSRSQWPRGLRRGSAAAYLLELRFLILQEARMFFLSCVLYR